MQAAKGRVGIIDLQHPLHVLSKLLSAIDAGADLQLPAAMWKAASVAGALWRRSRGAQLVGLVLLPGILGRALIR